jgi:hypothetical protein
MPHHLMACHISSLKNISKKSICMSQHFMSHYLCPLKNNSKIQENHLIPRHFSLLKNNSENSSSMSHHLLY